MPSSCNSNGAGGQSVADSAGADASYQRTDGDSYETGLAINGMAECSRPSSP